MRLFKRKEEVTDSTGFIFQWNQHICWCFYDWYHKRYSIFKWQNYEGCFKRIGSVSDTEKVLKFKEQQLSQMDQKMYSDMNIEYVNTLPL